MKKLNLTIILCLIALMCPHLAHAEQKTMLIINSYNEDAPWSAAMVTPINYSIVQNDTVRTEIVHMNGMAIDNEEKFNSLKDHIISKYANDNPEYVVMIGNFAFALRDAIKEHWGDVPILLLSRIDRYAPLSYYFSGYTGPDDWDLMPHLSDLRKDYNFTLIEVPDNVNASIDLMKEALPDLNEVVLLGDSSYSNRAVAKRMQKYIARNYPGIEFNWVQASDSTVRQYRDIMSQKTPGKGYLMSSWAYETRAAKDDMSGFSTNDLRLMPSSVNPIFSLRESYLNLGAIGGVYTNSDQLSEAVNASLIHMLETSNMRDLPFYDNLSHETRINYPLVQVYGLDPDNFPKETLFMNHPLTFWDKYKWTFIFCIGALAICILSALIYIKVQRRRISLLQTHLAFIKNLPMPYTKAFIHYDAYGKVIDVEYNPVLMNDLWRELMQKNERHYDATTTNRLFEPAFISQMVIQMVAAHEPVRFNYHFAATDTYYEFTMCMINKPKSTGKEIYTEVDIFGNNITALSKADAELKRATKTLELTMQISKIVPFVWDVKENTITYDLERFLEITGVHRPIEESSATIPIGSYIELVHPEDMHKVLKIFDDFRDGSIASVHDEWRLYSHDAEGRQRLEWLEANAAVVGLDPEGKPKLVIGSINIITQRKKNELDLIEAKEKASEADRMKSAFLANMSHEIRTPLNAIVGFSNLIARTNDEEKKQKFTSIIEHNNDLLLHLINDVLDLAKIESNTLEMNYSIVNINDLMASVRSTVHLRIPQNIMFNMVLGSPTCYAKADPNRLQQVLINLLTNASKFTSQGSISFGYDVFENELYFYVKDTGIGISLENQKLLFHRFSKLNNFVQGTGLGLSISKSFIEKMGGQIGVKSRGEGRGSTFWFTLPYDPTLNPVEDNPDAPQGQGGEALALPEAESERQGVKTEDITILIAEDNPSNYTLFESMLGDRYKLIHANDGAEAIEMYKQYRPHLILMDINMPNVDGYQATAEIRKMSNTVPIIGVTAYAFVADKKKILSSGFNDYVAKPIKEGELSMSIRKALDRLFLLL